MDYSLETVVSWAKRKWFVYPGSDIYGGLANAWDLWPYGTMLRKNILDSWYETFTQRRSDIIPLDAAILMNVKTWEASGHLWNFSDPLVDDKNTGERFRVDKIIEDVIEWFRKKIENNLTEYIRYWHNLLNINFDKKKLEILSLNEKLDLFDDVVDNINSFDNSKYTEEDKKIEKETKYLLEKLRNWWLDNVILDFLKEWDLQVDNLVPESWTFEQMKAFIEKYIPNNPNSWKKANWTDIRKFNLMFKTFQWVTEDNTATIYLRPETAQGIFVNFK